MLQSQLTARPLPRQQPQTPCCVRTSNLRHINRKPFAAFAASRSNQQCAAVAVVPQQQVSRFQRRAVAWICRSSLAPQVPSEPIPDDVQLEVNPDSSAKDVLYDEDTKTVRIPLSALNDGQRRTKMVMFTCNKCGGRSARLVNPVAWERGAVFCQCQHCAAWHMLKADKSIVEEIRYNDPDWQLPEAREGTSAAAAEAAALAASGGVAEVVPEDSQQSTGTGLALGDGAAADEQQDDVTSKQRRQQ